MLLVVHAERGLAHGVGCARSPCAGNVMLLPLCSWSHIWTFSRHPQRPLLRLLLRWAPRGLTPAGTCSVCLVSAGLCRLLPRSRLRKCLGLVGDASVAKAKGELPRGPWVPLGPRPQLPVLGPRGAPAPPFGGSLSPPSSPGPALWPLPALLSPPCHEHHLLALQIRTIKPERRSNLFKATLPASGRSAVGRKV